MAAAKFKFIEVYRRIAPAAGREIVAARQKGHDKLYPLLEQTMERVYDVCRLAFLFPQSSIAVVEWFEKTVKKFDPQFSIEHDKAEAGRIASMLLRDLMWQGNPKAAFAILVCSFCGRRSPIDNELLIVARDAVGDAARERRIVLAEKQIAMPPPKDLKATIEAVQQSWGEDSTRAAFDAVIADLRKSIRQTASSAADAHQSLRGDVIRLAEEVDMLWWHIGDWSETLDRPRTGLPKEAIGVVSGFELGDFVRDVPGPYGAYGILRRTLGKTSDRKAKLKDAVSSIGEDVKKFARQLPQSTMAVFPVHAALDMAADRGRDDWAAAFDQAASDIKDFDLSYFELAVQAFRERVLINYADLGQ